MGTKAMTSYDANGAPVETEATAVRRIRLRAGLREVTPGGEIEPLFEEYVLGEDHLAAIQRLSEQLAAAKRECSELQSRLGPPHPYKDGCYCSPCCIERLSTALAAERERCGRIAAAAQLLLDDMGEDEAQRHHRDKYRVYQISPQAVEGLSAALAPRASIRNTTHG